MYIPLLLLLLLLLLILFPQWDQYYNISTPTVIKKKFVKTLSGVWNVFLHPDMDLTFYKSISEPLLKSSLWKNHLEWQRILKQHGFPGKIVCLCFSRTIYICCFQIRASSPWISLLVTSISHFLFLINSPNQAFNNWLCC